MQDVALIPKGLDEKLTGFNVQYMIYDYLQSTVKKIKWKALYVFRSISLFSLLFSV